MKKIVCFHLLNDYSGSPKVLYIVLEELLKRGYYIELISSKGGILDSLNEYPNLKTYHYRYVFSNNTMVTFLRYFFVQIYTSIFALRYIFYKDCVFYINTILPFGPALIGRIMRKSIIYHYHENAFAKGLFYKALASMMQIIAHKIICVSRYQASFLKQRQKIIIVPNALSEDFVKALKPNTEKAFEKQVILMLSSLKTYKGTLEFIELSRHLPQFNFVLIVNDTSENIENYISKIQISPNLKIYSRQNDVSPFYNNASLVVNLTNKLFAIETFGLTILEAMTAGLPVIVPSVGGIAELVDNGVNGYKIDVQDLTRIEEQIKYILGNKQQYIQLSLNAIRRSKQYSVKEMTDTIVKALN